MKETYTVIEPIFATKSIINDVREKVIYQTVSFNYQIIKIYTIKFISIKLIINNTINF